MTTLNSFKLNQVIRNVKNDLNITKAEATSLVNEYVFADWHEGDEHQEWLNEAPTGEIADWVISCSQ